MRTKSLIAVALLVVGLAASGCRKGGGPLAQAQQQRAGDYQVTLLAPGGQFVKGQNQIGLAFERNGQPVDAGTLQVSCTMPMPGMPTMVAPVSVQPTGAPGRYEGTISYEMTGQWDLVVGFANGQRTQFKVPVK